MTHMAAWRPSLSNSVDLRIAVVESYTSHICCVSPIVTCLFCNGLLDFKCLFFKYVCLQISLKLVNVDMT